MTPNPEIPIALQGTYKLTPDAIRAVEELVAKRFKKIISNISLDEVVFKKYQEQLDTYMMKQYPDLSNVLNSLALNLKSTIEKINDDLKDMKFRQKAFVKSENLYKDVYELRDEVKKLKENCDKF